ncbi:hypothetical protein AGABI2DRAFT_121983 [Agaricus bisporus var. bisporus H97]|uniref:hypothetical protein n=1 Tax=Agaricus bisporus var. bisporus (strain H97 / ATCC MYA-4626 / FGSC 10389) TaxID=936046 RepID=UPI00029F5A9A|nr:hypothetical protein AGABI2DRAFT_121983 [Agaricus bisporus var. bisporus H97]EKV43088.1 hypothetical protein AGABI2DRAFT_121983 [Agaricus bisporus var. bisporus H97]
MAMGGRKSEQEGDEIAPAVHNYVDDAHYGNIGPIFPSNDLAHHRGWFWSMGANITVLSSKYIHLTTLIQIGIVKAKTAGSLLSKPMLGSTCEVIPQYELKALYDQVMGHLRQP